MNKYIFILSICFMGLSCKNEKREEVVIPVLETKKIDTLISQSNTVDSTVNSIKKISTINPSKNNKELEIKIKKNPAPTKATEHSPQSPRDEAKPVLKPESRTNKNQLPNISDSNPIDNENIIGVSEKPILQIISYDSYNMLLKKYVSNYGKVDYASLKANSDQLDNCLAELKKKCKQLIGLKMIS